MSSPAPRVSRYPRVAATPSPSRTLNRDTSVSELFSSPDHSERSHGQKLATAKANYDNTRSKANQVLELHEEQERRRALLEQARLNTERLRIADENIRISQEQQEKDRIRIAREEAAREQERKARELAAQTVPPLSPLRQPAPKGPAVKPPAPTPPQGATSSQQTTSAAAPISKSAPNTATATSVATSSATNVSVPSPQKPAAIPQVANARKARALTIHKNLKELRKNVEAQAKSNPALKAAAGDLRREIRKCIGQLSLDDKTQNTALREKVTKIMMDGLANSVGSSNIDPSHYVFQDRRPDSNSAELPSLFLYLVNHLAKAVIKQFIGESSANTKTADPIGVLVAFVFSTPQFLWCGEPLIDILIAKFHVVCPVLFGAQGDEATEQGRDQLGYPRMDGRQSTKPDAWTAHYNRQRGLGAGFAAVTLRDFSKSKKTNPYPVNNYWEAFAVIVNTKITDLSMTQCVVLKAMLENYEQRFLLFYGHAGMAALRLALVDIPAQGKASGKSIKGVDLLEVLGNTLRDKHGLILT